MSTNEPNKRTRRTPAQLKADNLANLERAKKQPNDWIVHLPSLRYGGTTRQHLANIGLETKCIAGLTYVKYSSDQLCFDDTPTTTEPVSAPISVGEILNRWIEHGKALKAAGIGGSTLLALIEGWEVTK